MAESAVAPSGADKGPCSKSSQAQGRASLVVAGAGWMQARLADLGMQRTCLAVILPSWISAWSKGGEQLPCRTLKISADTSSVSLPPGSDLESSNGAEPIGRAAIRT